ncbi:MAG: S9 family peptidase, partial [Woeseiaceae bacterium]|nr:S9 family peptidase [Woeseiaceae bacterium]
MEVEIWSVDIGSGELSQLTDRNGPDFSPVLSPDGAKLAYLGFDDKMMGYHNSDVHVMNLSNGSIEVLTADFDRSINDVQWAGSSNRLYVQYDDRGKTNIATLSLSGQLSSVADDVGGAILGRPYTSGGFSVANNGAYAYGAGRADRPADVAVGKGSSDPKRLTSLNEGLLGNRNLAAVEEITWRSSADDLEVQGWLVTPPGFDSSKKYPLLLEIHGGPFAAYGPH